MWEVVNTTDFPALGSWVQDRDGRKIWLVAVKASFDIGPGGRLTPAAAQMPCLLQAQHRDGDFEASLLHESDVFAPKPCTDIIVQAEAWAPGGQPTGMVEVGMRVGPVAKRLVVFGDRWWSVGLSGRDAIAGPAPFLHRPVVWEDAFGGWDREAPDPADHRMEARNPVGKGLVTHAPGRLGRPLPNVERPEDRIGAWHDRPEPAGLGAVACHWSPRRELAGTYDEAWLKGRFPLWALDFDPRYACAAPRDQQAEGYLKGGEPVRLVNLTPEGVMEFALPRLVFGFATRFGAQTVHHRGRLASVIVQPGARRLVMVWQSALLCERRIDDLDQTTLRLKERIAWAG